MQDATLRSWQWFNACLKILGKDRFYAIFRVSLREAQRWSANPAHCAAVRNNPIDQIHAAMRELTILGQEDIAEAAPAMLARALGKRLQDIAPVEDDRPLPQRFANAMAACADYIQAVASGLRYEELHPLLEEAVASLESLYVERRTVELGRGVCGEVRFKAVEQPKESRAGWWPFRKRR